MKKDLRKAHFNFGNDNITYETSHQLQFKKDNAQRSATDMSNLKLAQTERKFLMR